MVAIGGDIQRFSREFGHTAGVCGVCHASAKAFARGHLGRADLVRVRQRVPRGRGGASDGAQLALYKRNLSTALFRPVAGQLHVEQCDDVAPRRKGPLLRANFAAR